ncbi:plasmid pRiA4b ORF-3 family protein [Demequina soli]|uniref:plasmid pRiA4b ORF-3 family protein n=1 Tax=Demequina soli TaxID=1638987 RepID=UPI0007852B8E|nr:plasmid pRiA4b ORF-3 family protein [Demequina soli]
MASDELDPNEIRRRFDALLAGRDLQELTDLARSLTSMLGPDPAARGATPTDLRRSLLDVPRLLTVTVDLGRSHPRIWRRAEVVSDMPLAQFADVLIDLFGWAGTHLWRFGLGGGPFDAGTHVFLCDWEAEDGEDGTPASSTRLDQVLQDAGDVVRFAYDYGDSWELTVRVDSAVPAPDDAPRARCTGGRRAAPPEDCGGFTDAEDLARIIDDPAAFDVAEVNAALSAVEPAMVAAGINAAVVEIATSLKGWPGGNDIITRAWACAGPVHEPTREEAEVALGPVLWFLGRAADGLPLTAAGYLKPDLVKEAAAVVPAQRDLPWKVSREYDAHQLHAFRILLRDLGLLRKYKDRVLLTKAGKACHEDPLVLWRHLVQRLRPLPGRDFMQQATALTLLHLATAPQETVRWDAIADALDLLGWVNSDRSRLRGYQVRNTVPVWALLSNLEPREPRQGLKTEILAPAAGALARAALSDSQ